MTESLWREQGNGVNPVVHAAEKSRVRLIRPVPQTDTGGQERIPKAIERIMVKELGKITPVTSG